MSKVLPGPELVQVDPVHVRERGRTLLYFGGCDYFRLSWNASVRKAVGAALREGALNVAASRATTGNHPLYGKLEGVLARFFAVPTATLASSGYATAVAVSQALREDVTHVLIDEKAHGCLREAVWSWRAAVRVFRHADPDHVRALARRWPGSARPLLVTDGMFAHDGSMAPLREYREALPEGARIWVDDAHGAGLMGKHGRGAREWSGISARGLIQTISLGKAFGVYGGAILGEGWMRSRLLKRAEILAGNTPLPLPLVAGVLEAVRQLEAHPEWRQSLLAASEGLKLELRGLDWPSLQTPGPIVSWMPTVNPTRMIHALRRAGIHPCFIRYQGRPGYFRFAISSGHERRHLERLTSVLTRAFHAPE